MAVHVGELAVEFGKETVVAADVVFADAVPFAAELLAE